MQSVKVHPLSPPDKPVIIRPSSSCVIEEMEVLCHCSVDSNPKPAVTWSVNGTVPPHEYNTSVTSEPHMLTVTLKGRMDKQLTVICIAVNALGNDSLGLLLGEGVFKAQFRTKTTVLPLLYSL